MKLTFKQISIFTLGTLISVKAWCFSDIKPRIDYLIISKNTADHYAKLGLDIKKGIYLSDKGQSAHRKDLKNLSNGGRITINGNTLVVGQPSGEVSGTRNEIWGTFNKQVFLLKSQQGDSQQINNGVPFDIIPAMGGAFLVISKNRLIFRNHDITQNDEIKANEKQALSTELDSKKLFSFDTHSYALSRTGRNLIYLSKDKKIMRLSSKGIYTELGTFEVNASSKPQVSLSGDGFFLPEGDDSVKYFAFDEKGNVIEDNKIFTKRKSEKIVFYKGDTMVTQQKASGGRGNYYLTKDGKLVSAGQRSQVVTKMTAGDLNSLMSYAEDMGSKSRLGSFKNIYDRKKYVAQVLRSLQNTKKTWVNIIAPYGSGKADLLKSIAKQLTAEKFKANSPWKDYEVFNFTLASLLKVQAAKKSIEEKKKKAMAQNANLKPGDPNYIDTSKFKDPVQVLRKAILKKKVVLLMDKFLNDPELGPTNASKAMDLFLQNFRSEIEKGDLKVVTTSETNLWQKVSTQNNQLRHMLSVVSLTPPSPIELKKILRLKMAQLERAHHVVFEDGVEDLAIHSSKNLYPTEAEPLRSIKAAESLATHYKGSRSNNISKHLAQRYFLSFLFDSESLKDIDIDKLGQHLNKQLVGQREAKNKILRELGALTLGATSLDRPVSTMLFTGPTGVGKTLSANAIAEHLGLPLVKIDMNYFKGFQGESKESTVIRGLKNRPYVLLLDEVDKSPNKEEILSQLRGMLDVGIYAEGTEDELSFKNAIIIMTANYADQMILNNQDTDHDILIEKVRTYVLDPGEGNEKDKIPHHVWSRLQESVVIFKGLTEEDLRNVAKKFAKKLDSDFQSSHGITIEVGDRLIESIVATSLESKMGAVPVRDRIVKTVKRKISNYLNLVKRRDKDRNENTVIKRLFVEQSRSGKVVVVNKTSHGSVR